jgi:hypothetical protein
MTIKRFALSLLFAWHVLAVGLGSLASPGAVVPVGPPRYPENDVIAAFVTPRLDALAAAVYPAASMFDRAPLLLQQAVGNYLSLTGVSQSWKMFSNPPMVHQYLRVRYYVGPAAGAGQVTERPSWTATELVLPAHREDEVRLVRGYWDAFRDKAMTSALGRFHQSFDPKLIKPETKSAELPDHLAPILRYFARRFERTALRSDETILRSEIWYGTAPMPAPGETAEPGRVEARHDALREYYQGPVEDHFGRPVYPVYHAGQREADILWVLEYFEP